MNTIGTKKRTSTSLHTKVKRIRDHPKDVAKVPPSGASKINLRKKLNQGIKTPLPSVVKPMLATLVNEPFDDPNWLFEIKWDGYRTIGIINKGTVTLLSRNNKSFTEKYYPVTQALSGWMDEAVIDGEIIVSDESGISDFGSLQNWRSEADGELIYYIFDLLWLRGRSLMELTLSERQALLKEILPGKDNRIRISQTFPGNGKELFQSAKNLGLEGIIAKNSNSTYVPGLRSKSWLKIKAQKRQEVIIGGYTLNEGTGKYFSSLLLGVNKNGTLHYAGKVGTGFNSKMQKQMLELFKPLIIPSSPFTSEPDINEASRFRPNPPHATAVWLKPERICEVSYTEVTKDGVFRHPSFKGMRADKKPEEVTLETERGTDEILQNEVDTGNSPWIQSPKATSVKTLLNPYEETQVKELCGHSIRFTHLSKIYWPEEGFTKRDLFNYYYSIAAYILPYLKDRPQSLNRFPNGITGKSFYQKNIKGKAPDWVTTFPYTTSDGDNKEFLVGSDTATLLWMASLGCIEMNPWFSRVQRPDYPDYCIIDLDPDQNTFEQVIEAARIVKEILDQAGVPSFPKTSGSTGMHIYIPLGAKYTYDQSQLFARLIVHLVHQRIPEYSSVERMIHERHGKMYLDFLQNRPGATIASPYSLRPKPGATVSMPMHWDEVKKGLKMKDYNIRNAADRLQKVGDLFEGVLGEGIDMHGVLQKLKAEYGDI